MLTNASSKFHSFGLLILRMGIGLSFAINHGYRKVFGGPDTWESLGNQMANLGIDFLPVFWGFMAGFAEFFGGILIAIGFLTRPMALLLAFTMVIAIIKHQLAGEGFTYPLEMLVVAVAIMVMGAGKYSLDHHIKFKR